VSTAPALVGVARRRVHRRRGHDGAKKIGVSAIMIQGNMPIGNSSAVSRWKAMTAANATGRVRRQSSSGTTAASNSRPAYAQA